MMAVIELLMLLLLRRYLSLVHSSTINQVRMEVKTESTVETKVLLQKPVAPKQSPVASPTIKPEEKTAQPAKMVMKSEEEVPLQPEKVTKAEDVSKIEDEADDSKDEDDASSSKDKESEVKKPKFKKKPEISQKMLVRIVTQSPRGSLWKMYTMKRGEAVDSHGSQAVIDDCVLMPIMSPPTGQKEFIKPQDLQNFFVFLRLLLDSQNAKNKLSFCLNCFAFKQFTYRTTYLSISLAWIFPSFQKHCKYQTLPNTTSTDPTALSNPSQVLAQLADEWESFLQRFSGLFAHHGFIRPAEPLQAGVTGMASFLHRGTNFQVPSYFNKCISVHRMHKPDLCAGYYRSRQLPNPLVLYPEYDGTLADEARACITGPAPNTFKDAVSAEWREWKLRKDKGDAADHTPTAESEIKAEHVAATHEIPPIEAPYGCESESECSGLNTQDSDDSSDESDKPKSKGIAKNFTFASSKKKKKTPKTAEVDLPSFVRGDKNSKPSDGKQRKSDFSIGMASSSSGNKNKRAEEPVNLGKRNPENVTVPLEKFTRGPTISEMSDAISKTLGI